MKKINLVLIIALCLFSLAACAKKEDISKTAEAVPVKAMRVELRDLSEILEYVGNIKAKDEAMVYPRVNGKIIEKIKEDGIHVSKGEPILYIDRDEVGFKFEKAPVESPLTGIVGRVYVDIGENVTTQTPVALVVDMDKVKIDLDVPEKYLPQVSLGQSATIGVDAYPEEEFLGIVTKVSPVVDLETRSAPVEITVDNPQHRLKSGMFSRVRLVLKEHKDVPAIMKEAVMGKEPDLYVYLIKDNKAVLRKVSLGLREGPYYQVREGVKEGDLVVIMGQQRLKENSPVSVEIEETKK
ncbi:MAG: efflux RND transporter periplasmic adaptor subunit [Candidatus Omnitrophota bacterium]